MKIRQKMKMLTLATVIAFSSVNGVHAGGIPVYDGAQFTNSVKQLAEMANQLANMKAQLKQAQQQYSALVGSRNLGAILNNPALKNALPENWQTVHDNIQKGGYKGLDGTAKALADAAKLVDRCAYLKNETSKQSCEAQAVQSAQVKADISRALDAAQKRLDQIEGLMNQINRTQDPKAIAELQARIGIEQAMIQNESTRLQMYQIMSQANEKMIAEQRKNARRDAMSNYVQSLKK